MMTTKSEVSKMLCGACLLSALTALGASTARAAEEEPTDAAAGESADAARAPEDGKAAPGEVKDAEKKKDRRWGGRLRDHAKQGFVNVLVGTGYYLVAPYDKDNPDKMCERSADDPGKGEPLCSGRVGWHMDFLAGYGLKPGLELFMMFRLGLERPDSGGLINQPKTRQLGVGIKVYTPKGGFFKLGFGVAPLIDFSNRGGSVGVRPDFVIHVPIQALFDIFPWFGAYAQVAPNLSFIAEFKVEFTGGIGVQGRFP